MNRRSCPPRARARALGPDTTRVAYWIRLLPARQRPVAPPAPPPWPPLHCQ